MNSASKQTQIWFTLPHKCITVSFENFCVQIELVIIIILLLRMLASNLCLPRDPVIQIKPKYVFHNLKIYCNYLLHIFMCNILCLNNCDFLFV